MKKKNEKLTSERFAIEMDKKGWHKVKTIIWEKTSTNLPNSYLLIDEFIGTQFEPLIPQIKGLTDKVNKADIIIITGEFHTRKK